MARTVYTTPVIAAGGRRAAMRQLGDLLEHLEPLGLSLVSVVRNADNSVAITLSGPLPTGQIEHLGFDTAKVS